MSWRSFAAPLDPPQLLVGLACVSLVTWIFVRQRARSVERRGPRRAEPMQRSSSHGRDDSNAGGTAAVGASAAPGDGGGANGQSEATFSPEQLQMLLGRARDAMGQDGSSAEENVGGAMQASHRL